MLGLDLLTPHDTNWFGEIGTKPNCFTAAMIPDVEPLHVLVIAEDSVKVHIVDTQNSVRGPWHATSPAWTTQRPGYA